MLNAESTVYIYDSILEVATTPGFSPRDKIIKLRPIFEHLFNELTKGEPQYFPDLFARCVFVIDKHRLTPIMASQIHGFRKLANKTIHELTFDPGEPQYLASINAICDCTEHFSSTPVPAELVALYRDQGPSFGDERPTPARETVPFLSLIVRSVGDERVVTFANGRAGKQYSLFGTTEDGDALTILIDERFITLRQAIYRYARVNLFDLRVVPNKDRLYATTHSSLLVVEPDLLIDATEMAGCFSGKDANPLIYLLNKFLPTETTQAMLLGNVVNHLFDDCLSDHKVAFGGAFEQAIAHQPLAVAALDEQALKTVKDEAEKHFQVVQKVVHRINGDLQAVEPTFLSPDYGLQGRLDALFVDGAGGNARDVIELKTGKAPAPGYSIPVDGKPVPVGIWANNLAQVTAYNLLLGSAYAGRTGSSSILYSSDQAIPLRYAEDIRSFQRMSLLVRNHIAALEYRLAHNDYTGLEQLQEPSAGTMPAFLVAKADNFATVLGSCSPLEKKYFLFFASFIAREFLIAKIGTDVPDGDEGFTALWKKGLEEKQTAFRALGYLHPVGVDASPGVVTFERTAKTAELSSFRAGDIAVVYPLHPDGSADPVHGQIIKCTIADLKPKQVVVTLRNKRLNPSYFAQASLWALEPDMLDSSYDSMYQSLYAFLGADRRKRNLLLGLEPPRFADIAPIASEVLNDDQSIILTRALSAKDYFLLQGPPGTGKTRFMLREMVRHLWQSTQEHVILLAFTNRAVDEMCEAVASIQEVPFIRLGSTADPRFRERTLNSLSANRNPRQVKEIIQETRVFISTVASFAGNTELTKLKRFSTAIVDEASQLIEPQLVGVLTRVERFILIGDHKQLPAVVLQSEDHALVDDNDLRQVRLTDMRTSLFERLWDCQQPGWPRACAMLEHQGRMHVDVAQFPNEQFYSGSLKHIEERQLAPHRRFSPTASDPVERALARGRVIFIPSQREHRAKINEGEAATVCRVLAALKRAYGADFRPSTAGVIVPYRAQIAEVRKRMHSDPELEALVDSVTVDTVERFQGSQRDVIILSFAVNHHAQLNNLVSLTADGKVDRKLNVALTRAREQLVILGCPEVLQSKKHFRALIEHIKRVNGYIAQDQLKT